MPLFRIPLLLVIVWIACILLLRLSHERPLVKIPLRRAAENRNTTFGRLETEEALYVLLAKHNKAFCQDFAASPQRIQFLVDLARKEETRRKKTMKKRHHRFTKKSSAGPLTHSSSNRREQ